MPFREACDSKEALIHSLPVFILIRANSMSYSVLPWNLRGSNGQTEEKVSWFRFLVS